jgi:putative transposase
LSISRQCELLSLNRSSYYYQPVAVSDSDLALMLWLDKQYLKTPFYGYRKMTAQLHSEGQVVNHKRVKRLMSLMNMQAIYCLPNSSKAIERHKKYPYLLKGLVIKSILEVWATDITYVPMARGYMYLMAVIDLYSRLVLSWDVSNTMDADWCTQVLKKALDKHGKPRIFNTDQGSQFTSDIFINTLLEGGIQPSMDGKGRCLDNIFIERLWRTVKYEHIYLHVYQDGHQLLKGLSNYFNFYNQERLHQHLQYKTPDEVHQAEILKKPDFFY